MSWQDIIYEIPSTKVPIIQLRSTKKQLDKTSLDIIISYKRMLEQTLYICDDDTEQFNLERKLDHVKEHLSVICEHKWISDYIDSGPDNEMKKITYCKTCELDEHDIYDDYGCLP